jgi:hypothetical protein
MSTNYDFIAEQYKRAKLQPWRAHVESFTLLGVIGDEHGQVGRGPARIISCAMRWGSLTSG